jgi:hypothetical protein
MSQNILWKCSIQGSRIIFVKIFAQLKNKLTAKSGPRRRQHHFLKLLQPS